jgi:hypothetical protein
MRWTAKVTRRYIAQSIVAGMESRSCYESVGPASKDALESCQLGARRD